MNLTPKQVVDELNQYIIGQDEAKKAAKKTGKAILKVILKILILLYPKE